MSAFSPQIDSRTRTQNMKNYRGRYEATSTPESRHFGARMKCPLRPKNIWLTVKKILRHIVNCKTKRHDCAYSIPGGFDDYHSRTGVGGFGISPRSANESPVWFDGRRVNRNRSVRCTARHRLYRQQRRTLSQRRAYDDGDALRLRYFDGTKAFKGNKCQRFRARLIGLSVSRHWLCSWHS